MIAVATTPLPLPQQGTRLAKGNGRRLLRGFDHLRVTGDGVARVRVPASRGGAFARVYA